MGGRFQWVFGLLVVALVGATGVYAYNLGVAQGVAQSASLAAQGSGAPWPVWYGPWHGGFGFFPFGPLLIILFWVILVRGLFWRRGWYGHRYDYYGGVPPAFDEWHRRAHARQDSAPPAGPQA